MCFCAQNSRQEFDSKYFIKCTWVSSKDPLTPRLFVNPLLGDWVSWLVSFITEVRYIRFTGLFIRKIDSRYAKKVMIYRAAHTTHNIYIKKTWVKCDLFYLSPRVSTEYFDISKSDTSLKIPFQGTQKNNTLHSLSPEMLLEPCASTPSTNDTTIFVGSAVVSQRKPISRCIVALLSAHILIQ